MIPGLDSSFDRPSLDQARQAFAAGVRVWGGYLVAVNGQGLAAPWPDEAFATVQQAGLTAIGFCSGWDDPVAIRDKSTRLGVLACLDVEPGIRDDGLWVQSWLNASGSGLYGLCRVHSGREAAFHVVARYPGFDPHLSWDPACPRPAGPLAWQWQGTHTEFGLSVDSAWYDDSFGGLMLTPDDVNAVAQAVVATPDFQALVWRVKALIDNLPAVERSTVAGEVNALRAAIANIPGGNNQAVLDAIAQVKLDLDGLTLKRG